LVNLEQSLNLTLPCHQDALGATDSLFQFGPKRGKPVAGKNHGHIWLAPMAVGAPRNTRQFAGLFWGWLAM